MKQESGDRSVGDCVEACRFNGSKTRGKKLGQMVVRLRPFEFKESLRLFSVLLYGYNLNVQK